MTFEEYAVKAGLLLDADKYEVAYRAWDKALESLMLKLIVANVDGSQHILWTALTNTLNELRIK